MQKGRKVSSVTTGITYGWNMSKQNTGKLQSWVMELPLGECASTFNLVNAVCNHAFFMMAPNRWIPSTNTFQRPLRLADGTTSVTVFISQPPECSSLRIQIHGFCDLSSLDQQSIRDQVVRMLRLSSKDENDVREFQKVHPEGKKRGFGRLFRAPTSFEDTVKSLLLCNCGWERSLKMSRALCELQFRLANGLISPILEPHGKAQKLHTTKRKGLKRKRTPIELKRKRATSESEKLPSDRKLHYLANFPSAKELASLSENVLEKHCKLGYRANQILQLAKNVESRELQLSEMEVCDFSASNELYRKLMNLRGFGDFACANVLMCLGFYEKVPKDSETLKLLQEVHIKRQCTMTKVQAIIGQIYGKYAPFQCIAYWLDLLDYYENKCGKLSVLCNSSYGTVTSSKWT